MYLFCNFLKKQKSTEVFSGYSENFWNFQAFQKNYFTLTFPAPIPGEEKKVT